MNPRETSSRVKEPGDLADWLGRRTLRASISLSRRTAFAVIVIGLAGSWLIIYLAGGADSMVPHWYYIPILFAATRFGPLAAFAVALVAGVLAGPLTYDDVSAGTYQDGIKWLTRTGFFIGIGQLMAWLVGPSVRPIGEELRELRERFDIRRGLGKGEFFLKYQPIYSVREQKYAGVEALLRWNHPEKGELSPAGFINTAETSDLIHEISDFVINEACRQASEWKQLAAASNLRPWHVAINLSARDLERPELGQLIGDTLQRYDLPAELLHVELTEGALAYESAVFQLRQLERLGITLAIDDFGTGYSSLSYLNRFPFHVIKIDRSLISGLTPDPSSQALARGMIQLARALRLVTIAEGMETGEQLAIGTKLKFDFAQGYLFSAPCRADEIPAMMGSEGSAAGDRNQSGVSRSP